MFPFTAFILLLLATMAGASRIRVATFNIGATFGETFFTHSLGEPGTADHDTVRDILARIGADVVALQEIHSVDLQGSPDDLEALAGYLGYDYVNVPPVTGVFDTTLRVVFISRFPFLESFSIAPPAGAKDMTRRHAVVTVDLPGTQADPLLISPHLKAGTATVERFQRAVAVTGVSPWISMTILIGFHCPSTRFARQGIYRHLTRAGSNQRFRPARRAGR